MSGYQHPLFLFLFFYTPELGGETLREPCFTPIITKGIVVKYIIYNTIQITGR